MPTDEKQFDTTGLHDKPILTAGSGGPAVHMLCESLAELGYSTSVSDGQNPYGIVDQSVLAAVNQFRSREGVEEDAQAFGTSEAAAAHIGPATWAALRDATSPSEPRSASSSASEATAEATKPAPTVAEKKKPAKKKSSSRKSSTAKKK